MAEQTPSQPPESPRPVSLRDDALSSPTPPPSSSSRVGLIVAAVAMVAVVLLALAFMQTGSSSEALSEEEVRQIVQEAMATERAALPVAPVAAAAGDSADVQALVNQAVGTQVALLRPTNTPIPPTPTMIPAGVAEEDDAFRGPADAPVVIVEFSDFQCSYCGRWYQQTLPQILETYPQEVKFVYRDFPIFGEESLNAAMASECAEEQGAFWDFHNRLFDRLTNDEPDNLSQETFVKYAADLGLDTDNFSQCLTSQKYLNEVIADYQAAQGYGFGGTPGFIINGVVYAIGAQPFEVFQGIIEGELDRLEAS